MEQPKYITKAPDFSCALSPYIAWHHGLKYKSCPLSFGQRDMPSCMSCSLKLVKNLKEKKHEEERKENKKEIAVNKSIIPKIGKTYVSD